MSSPDMLESTVRARSGGSNMHQPTSERYTGTFREGSTVPVSRLRRCHRGCQRDAAALQWTSRKTTGNLAERKRIADELRRCAGRCARSRNRRGQELGVVTVSSYRTQTLTRALREGVRVNVSSMTHRRHNDHLQELRTECDHQRIVAKLYAVVRAGETQ